ncbi:hypothetical protein [Peribacillus asahii]|uniref:hypothetical protein n=1 Tax=Peribacillus asahii TaxID=228899 RepID=UPI0020799EEA|nr:hypothetical protein [Peribacillus asahii]USK71263.1 hypothetical protein LIS76_05735 [Peribacillus asahii]
MEWEKAQILRSIAEELMKNNVTHLVDELAKYDHKMTQVLHAEIRDAELRDKGL